MGEVTTIDGRFWLELSPYAIDRCDCGIREADVNLYAEPAVRSLALVSPASEFRGLRADQSMRSFAARSGAALLVAGALDPYASRSAKQLAEIMPGMRDLRIVENVSANGRALLADQPDLAGALVDWFRKTLL